MGGKIYPSNDLFGNLEAPKTVPSFVHAPIAQQTMLGPQPTEMYHFQPIFGEPSVDPMTLNTEAEMWATMPAGFEYALPVSSAACLLTV
jgi:hypothetical protein